MNDKHRSAAVAAMLGKPRPRYEPEVEAREAFDDVRAPRVRGREGLMLDLRWVNGCATAFTYTVLERVEFVPGDRLRLFFGADVVQIEGRSLGELYERLLAHRVESIQEGRAAEARAKPPEAAHIDSLKLLHRKEIDDDDED